MKNLLFFLLSTLLFVTPSYSAVITQDDLTFLGGFQMPYPISYNRGITIRYVDGVLKMYTTKYDVNSGQMHWLYEMNVPETLDTSYPFDRLAEVVNWGDIYQDKIVETVDNGGSCRCKHNAQLCRSEETCTTQGWNWCDGTCQSADCSEPAPVIDLSCSGLGYVSPLSGIYWDEIDRRMYWMKVVSYNNSGFRSDAGLGFSTLDDSTKTGTGIDSWALDDPMTLGTGGWGGRYAFSMAAIPQDFANTYLGGKRLALGFGGSVAIISQGYVSIGPAVFALSPPDPAKEDSFMNLSTPPQRLLSHFAYVENAAVRPPGEGMTGLSFRDYDNGETAYWWQEDKARYGVWIDTGDKQGVLIWALMGAGNCDTTVTNVISKSEVTVADPGDLRAGDMIRIYTSYEPSPDYIFEQRRITSVNDKTITFETETTGSIATGATLQGGDWYAGGGPTQTRFWTPLYIYDQNDLALVAQGELDANAVNPSSKGNFALEGGTYPLKGQKTPDAEEGEFVPRGIAYDPETNRIYFAARAADYSRTNVWVYQLSTENIRCYKDLDGDGYSDATYENAPGICSKGYSVFSALKAISGDCDDNDATSYPGAGNCDQGSSATPPGLIPLHLLLLDQDN